MNTENWSRENLAWLAGLFEGEGTLCAGRHVQGKNKETYIYWQVAIMMTDEDVVRKAHDIAGFGTVKGPWRSPSTTGKEKIRWASKSQKDIYAFLAAIYPFMGQRRGAKIEEFFADVNSRVGARKVAA